MLTGICLMQMGPNHLKRTFAYRLVTSARALIDNPSPMPEHAPRFAGILT